MQRVLLSGGNQGIGYYMVSQFLHMGYQAAVFDLKLDHISGLKEKYGDNLLMFECDISDPIAVAECVNKTAAAFGGIDYAVQNACKYMFASLEDTTDEDFRSVFNVNFFGAVNIARAVLPIMLKQGSGRIVYTCSSASITGYVYNDAYAPSKGALESLAKCLNIEYMKRGVTFHIMHPPLTDTGSIRTLSVRKGFKVDPAKVGIGLAKNIHKRNFIICHSLPQYIWIKMLYMFPIGFGIAASNMILRSAGYGSSELIRYKTAKKTVDKNG